MEHKLTENVIITSTDESLGIVEAIWAVMGNVDEGKDIIHPGSFTKTFHERGNQIKLLDNHRSQSVMNSLGIVKELKEIGIGQLPGEVLQQYPDATGAAWGKFQFLMDTPEGKGAFSRLKSGAIQGWSFGYDAIQKDHTTITDKNGTRVPVRNLRELKLYEISPVIFPMNEATFTTDVKSKKHLSLTEKLEQDNFEDKAVNLSHQVETVRSAFYNQHPDIYDDERDFYIEYYCKQIWDEFLIVSQHGSNGNRLWKINYTIDNNMVAFDQPQDWIEVTIEYVPLNQNTTETMSIEPSKSQNKTLTSNNEAGPLNDYDTRLKIIEIELQEMELEV